MDLTDQHFTAISHLIRGKSKAETAQLLETSRVTIWRWSQDPDFAAALNSARLDAHQANIEMLRDQAGAALIALSDLLASDNDRVRLSAAATILKHCNLSGELTPPETWTDPKAIARQNRIAQNGTWIDNILVDLTPVEVTD